MITRALEQPIKEHLYRGKAILLYGPRQSGKTTLVKQIISDSDKPHLLLNGDEPDVRDLLSNITSTRLKAVLGNHKLVVIDEAQMIPNIGITLKLITDQLDGIQVIATGSSSFELAGETKEPLTGRKYEYHLFPLGFAELVGHTSLLEEMRMLKHRLVFGSYPEVVTCNGEEAELLRLLAGSYLYKDIMIFEGIKKPILLDKIARALAFQVGSEVSFTEVGQLTGCDYKTVERYIDILERACVVFTLPAFSRNLRNEIKKGRKIYFYDNGIRNAVIGNFNEVEARTDVGVLWENYLVSERVKLNWNASKGTRSYFWRTVKQQEVDYVEDSGEALSALEFKWNPKSKRRIPRTFLNAYPEANTSIITPENYEQFLSSP